MIIFGIIIDKANRNGIRLISRLVGHCDARHLDELLSGTEGGPHSTMLPKAIIPGAPFINEQSCFAALLRGLPTTGWRQLGA
jgi:hypothetical protein